MRCRLVAFLSLLIASCWFAASGVPRTYCNSQHRNIQSDWRFHCTVSGWRGSCIPQFCTWKTRVFIILKTFFKPFYIVHFLFQYFPCSCPICGSKLAATVWGLAERPSLQRKLVVDAGFRGLSSAIIEHGVARDVAAQRKRTCPQEAALRTVLVDLGLKEAELTDIRNVEGVMWYPGYLGSSEMPESKMV